MKEAIVKYFGNPMKVCCDGNCKKAWGIDTRPTESLSDDYDDYAFLADDELGDAPENPGTAEGPDCKPLSSDEFPNKWCVRQCERCNHSKFGESMLDLTPINFDKRVYNYDSRKEEV
jgi:hypothetical protein